MTESDLLAAVGAAAVPFEVAPGVSLLLTPLGMPGVSEYRRFRKDNPDDSALATMKLVQLSAAMPDGRPLTWELLGMLPAGVVDKIGNRVAQLNGWGDAAGNS